MHPHKTPAGNGHDKSHDLKLALINNFPANVVPCAAGSKAIYEANWQNRVFDHDFMVDHVNRGGNVGLRMRGLGAFDIEDTELGDEIYGWLKQRLGEVRVRYRPGSPSKAILFATEMGVSGWNIDCPENVEGESIYLLQAFCHGQLHAAGTRADCGGVELQWNIIPDPAALPLITNAELAQVRVDLLQWLKDEHGVITTANDESSGKYSVDGDYVARRMDEDLLEKALQVIKRSDTGVFFDRKPRTQMMMAICGCTAKSERGKELWLEWDSGGGAPNDERKALKQWNALNKPGNPVRQGAGLILEHLERLGATALVDEIKRREALAMFDGDEDSESPSGSEKQREPSIEEQFTEALKRLREARDEAGHKEYTARPEGGFRSVKNSPMKRALIRPDVSDWLEKGKSSMMVSEPGKGKSSLSVVFALALALNRPEMIGLDKFDWLGDVVIISNEDGEAQINRQLEALMLEHKIKQSDLIYDIHVWTGDVISIATKTSRGVMEPTPEAIRLIDRLTEIRRNGPIAVCFLDTFASAVEGIDENAVADTQKAIAIGNRIAGAAFCSFAIIHHKRKRANGTRSRDADASDARGSGAIWGSIRHMTDVDSPSGRDIMLHGWSHAGRDDNIIRFEGSKANGRKKAAKQFFEFKSVKLTVDDPRDKDSFTTESVGILIHVDTSQTNLAARIVDHVANAETRSMEIVVPARGGRGRAPEGCAANYIIDEEGLTPRDRPEIIKTIFELIDRKILAEKTENTKSRNKRKLLVVADSAKIGLQNVGEDDDDEHPI